MWHFNDPILKKRQVLLLLCFKTPKEAFLLHTCAYTRTHFSHLKHKFIIFRDITEEIELILAKTVYRNTKMFIIQLSKIHICHPVKNNQTEKKRQEDVAYNEEKNQFLKTNSEMSWLLNH